jgi:NAD(P)H-dependent FMN reductase
MYHSSKPTILIIIGSTRPNRVGPNIAEWVHTRAAQRADARFEVVDLAEWNLPLLNEPVQAKMRMYQHSHTKNWSAKIARADGYIIVTPEYNHGYPAALKNALDYLYHEWVRKPVAFVGYGWGGGQLAVQQLRQVVAELKMDALPEQAELFFKPNMFDEQFRLREPAQSLASYTDETDALIEALSAQVIKLKKETKNEATV